MSEGVGCRVDCSRVTVTDRRRRVDQKTWGEQMEDKELSVGRRAELARRNMQLDQIREIGRGLVFGRFKGKNICAEREIRQEASVEHEESGICDQTRQNHK